MPSVEFSNYIVQSCSYSSGGYKVLFHKVVARLGQNNQVIDVNVICKQNPHFVECDIVSGIMNQEGNVNVLKYWYIQEPNHEEMIRRLIKKHFKSEVMYDKLLVYGDPFQIIDQTAKGVEMFCFSNFDALCKISGASDRYKCENLIRDFYEQYYRRPLLSLGIDKVMIENSYKTAHALKEDIYTNYTSCYYPSIPNTVANWIDIAFDKSNMQNSDYVNSKYMNYLSDATHKYANNFITLKKFKYVFPSIDINILQSEFRLKVENDKCYITDVYERQQFVIDSLIKIMNQEQQCVNTDNVDLVKFGMSDYQNMTVCNALKYNVSIITGAAGTGKCLSPNTEVLLYNGNYKLAKDIQPEDVLMGPDNEARYVKSTTRGIEMMYKIQSKINDLHFECNESHILTVFEPLDYVIKFKNNYYQVEYNCGLVRKTRLFNTEDNAVNFIKGLDNIYDIPLLDYLKLNRRGYLVHKRIHFPYSKIDESVYNIGVRCRVTKCFDNLTRILINTVDVREIFLKGLLNKSFRINYIPEIIRRIIESLGFTCNLVNNTIKIDKSHYNSIKEYSLYPFTVSQLKVDEYCGFELYDLDKRFMLGNYLVTHNTRCINAIIKCIMSEPYKAWEDRIDIINYNKSSKFPKPVICNDIYPFLLTAFTGKAVSRMKETLDMNRDFLGDKLCDLGIYDARTIHKLILSSGVDMINYLIIDEASMLNTNLLCRLLSIYEDRIKRIIFVGDVNQLEPIGWGSIFYQLIKSGCFPVFRLNRNYRNNIEDINVNCKKLIEAKDTIKYFPGDNFRIHEVDDNNKYDYLEKLYLELNGSVVILTCYNDSKDQINNIIQKVIRSREEELPNRIRYEDKVIFLNDVVTYQHVEYKVVRIKDNEIELRSVNNNFKVLDVDEIRNMNILYSSNLRDEVVEDFKFSKRTFHINDPVMQLKNEGDVYNGDIGVIVNIDCYSFTVNYNGIVVRYCTKQDMSLVKRYSDSLTYLNHMKQYHNLPPSTNVSLAYALTIDKSQGSEWDRVILFIDKFGYNNFINKNKIYTGITRCKLGVDIITTNKEKFEKISCSKPSFRNDITSDKLKKELKQITIQQDDYGIDESQYIVGDQSDIQDCYDDFD